MVFRNLLATRNFALILKSPLVNSKVLQPGVLVAPFRQSHSKTETDAEFDKRYLDYFNKPTIDGWEVRKGINDLYGHDLVPEPEIVKAILKACRRVNDFSLAVRYIESLKDKCGANMSVLWPYMSSEIKSTMDELGIPSLEELGYDKPELAQKDVFEM